MIKHLLLVYLSISSLYLWESGLPQVSHIVLMSLLLIYALYIHNFNFNSNSILLVFFVLYSFLLNVYFYSKYSDVQFLTSSFQIIFNALIFLFLYSLFRLEPKVAKYAVRGIIVGYILQWIVLLLGLGETKFFPRYAGTFNDPNQMAYWFLATFACYLLLKEKISKAEFVFIFITFVVFVVLSFSRSAFLGILFYVSGVIIFNMLRSIKVLVLFVSLMIMLVLGAFLINYQNGEDDKTFEIIADRILNIDFEQQADERGYTRFSEFPEYVIFGSGQGEHKRFNQNKDPSYLNVEMHTTWGGVLFYYGIPGFASILMFLLLGTKNLDKNIKLLVLSTFVYGLTTYSFRTPMFWVLLSVIYYVNEKSKELRN